MRLTSYKKSVLRYIACLLTLAHSSSFAATINIFQDESLEAGTVTITQTGYENKSSLLQLASENSEVNTQQDGDYNLMQVSQTNSSNSLIST